MRCARVLAPDNWRRVQRAPRRHSFTLPRPPRLQCDIKYNILKAVILYYSAAVVRSIGDALVVMQHRLRARRKRAKQTNAAM